MRNLLELLSSSAASEPRALGIAVRADDRQDLRALLLSDEDGYWLALWRAVPTYDKDENVAVDTVPVTVVLDEEADVEFSRPSGSLEGRDGLDGVTDVDVGVDGDPLLLRITPG